MDSGVRIPLSMLVLLAITSCVSAPPPPAPPARRVTPPPTLALPAPAPLASDWRDWPQTQGEWDYRRYFGKSSATYGRGDPGLVVLWCPVPGTIRLMVVGAVPGSAIIRTTAMTRTLALRDVGTGGIGAVLAASDPLLDAMAFSRGRFVVERAGQPPLVLPAWAEVARVIEDCRK